MRYSGNAQKPGAGSHNHSRWMQDPSAERCYRMAPIPAMTSNFAPKKRIENWVTMLARGLLARFRFAPEPE